MWRQAQFVVVSPHRSLRSCPVQCDRIVMNDTRSAFYQRLPSARRLWLNVHQWLGLTAGVALALIGLTGSLLVFSVPLLKMELGSSYFAGDGPPVLSPAVDEWIANAKRTFSDISAIDFIDGPGSSVPHDSTVRMGVQTASGQSFTVNVDPYSGRALGRYVWADTYTAYIYGLHGALTTSVSWRGFGRGLVGWIGLGMMISMATGLYLWWPRNQNWRMAFSFKRGARGRRRLIDLHNIFAVYLYVPLFILAFTGVYFVRSTWIDPAIALVSVPRTPDPAALAQRSASGSCSTSTTPGQAVTVAQARFPSTKFALLTIPRPSTEPYEVDLQSLDKFGVGGSTKLFVDRECPKVLAVIDGKTFVTAEAFQTVTKDLHHNLMLGRFGQAILFISGLVLPLSFVTGVLLWLGKRANRRPAS
jgi:uncharacterized iron-regulated membrane protein